MGLEKLNSIQSFESMIWPTCCGKGIGETVEVNCIERQEVVEKLHSFFFTPQEGLTSVSFSERINKKLWIQIWCVQQWNQWNSSWNLIVSCSSNAIAWSILSQWEIVINSPTFKVDIQRYLTWIICEIAQRVHANSSNYNSRPHRKI